MKGQIFPWSPSLISHYANYYFVREDIKNNRYFWLNIVNLFEIDDDYINIKIDIIGKTQNEIFEVENDLRISVKELKTKNESWFKNYNKN